MYLSIMLLDLVVVNLLYSSTMENSNISNMEMILYAFIRLELIKNL
jgi:hypothetical protein